MKHGKMLRIFATASVFNLCFIRRSSYFVATAGAS
jgi:hypothetical protein